MTEHQQRLAAKQFAEYWNGRGYERGESQPFWLSLLRDVMGIEHPEQYISFEDQVHLDHTSFIDGYISATKVMIEQKSRGKNLNAPIKQSDGSLLTPFQQAQRYMVNLPYSKMPRWVITSNFEEIWVYDMERPGGEPEKILVKDLAKEYYRLSFLVNTEAIHLQREMEVSFKAGELVGQLYDALLPQYRNPDSPQTLHSLNVLCVRLVFCLYCEDAGQFNQHDAFHDYLMGFDAAHTRTALIDLFRVLNQPVAERDPYLVPELAAFPYVNGGLFADGDVEIPMFTDAIRDVLLDKASLDFDWSEISPTIFGAVFESTLNPETRRKGGMHYTSIENIHKVIDPLFLGDLRHELAEIGEITILGKRMTRLNAFREKLANLRFLDPACGSGNFLTETYISLRRLENEALKQLSRGQMLLGVDDVIKVGISQFYGIEINDFAVTVAKTALWIAESQMMKETEDIVMADLSFLPLKSNVNIVHGNSLRIDWNEVCPKEELSYIMGNPPFVGARMKDDAQADDMIHIFGKKWKNIGNLDYVSCWYKKAADYMEGTDIHCALVSTNSITQGEQVAILWKPLFDQGIRFNFAYRTFRWDSEASLKAHVHCVIIGFSYENDGKKYLFAGEQMKEAENINGYLLDGPDVFIGSRSKPLCDVPEMVFGNMPNDGGFLSDYSTEQKDEIVRKYPMAAPLFRKMLGADEFINNKERWCLWLKGVSPSVIRSIPPVMEAVEKVREMRMKSTRESTQRLADTPTLFGEIRQPETNYLIVPRVSSERRKYIPIGFVDSNVICGDSTQVIPNCGLYEFGIMASNVHNAWMRAVCGRLEMRYRYSAKVVYNNFPWPASVGATFSHRADGTFSHRADGTSADPVGKELCAATSPTGPATVSVATNDAKNAVSVATMKNQSRNLPPILSDHCRGYLPHIENKRFQTITFRLYDSVPKEVLEKWRTELTEEERINPNDEKANRLRKLIQQYEDAGYGACYLGDDRVATIMQNALLFYNNKRYKLIAWCIMPNHVHVLVEMKEGISLSTIMHGWRSFTAHEANKVLNRTGQFWMEEYFDRFIRNEEHFQSAYNYIINNPVKAGLTENPEDWKYTGSVEWMDDREDDVTKPHVAGAVPSHSVAGTIPHLVVDALPLADSAAAFPPTGFADVSSAKISSAAVSSAKIAKIQRTAQAILDARALYPGSSLADLYDELTMPAELRHAHQQNDRAVMEAYGFDLRMTESECVAQLMRMYQEMVR